ncbi:hypothetical protein PTKIN_Ptkin01aG0000600 [Pterospermum kingtungense]
MLNIWVKEGVIDLYVKEDIDIAELVEDHFILTRPPTDGNNSQVGEGSNEGVECVNACEKGFSGNDVEDNSDNNEGNVAAYGDEDVYFVKVRYLSDGDDDDELQGLKIAVDELLLRVEHRNCARHVFANWFGKRRPKTYEFAFWKIVKLTIERQWEKNIEALVKLDDKAYKDLMSKQPKQWTKAFFRTWSKYDMVQNNGCEAFNSILVEPRHKSIITMLEEIRVYMMERIVERRKFAEKWRNAYRPCVKKQFDKQKQEGVSWQVVWKGDNGCEVKKGKMQYTVNLKKRICSCRLWQISGISCAHVCYAIWHDGGEPNEFLHKYYHKDTFLKSYQYSLQPINGSHEWKKSTLEPINLPIPKKTPGGPKTN